MASATQGQRIDFLDAARAILLLLGIPFHVSEIYRLSGRFLISSADTSYVASMISGLIHSFRMPAFFFLSGYFALLVIERRKPADWFKGRCVKLAVPLVATTVTLGVIERGLVIFYKGGHSLSDALIASLHLSPDSWVNHRWFLVILLLYCATIFGLHRHLSLIARLDEAIRARPAFAALANLALIVLLVALPFAAILCGKLFGVWLVESHALKGYAMLYVKYLVFFLAGAFARRIPEGLSRFGRVGLLDIAIFAACLSIYMVTYFAFYPGKPHPLFGIPSGYVAFVRVGIEVITGYYGARVFFAVIDRWFRGPNDLVRYFVDASFCIYLVHELFFLVGGGFLLGTHWNPLIEMPMICGFTLIGSTLVYEIARRVPLLAWPLNGGPFQLASPRARRLAVAG